MAAVRRILRRSRAVEKGIPVDKKLDTGVDRVLGEVWENATKPKSLFEAFAVAVSQDGVDPERAMLVMRTVQKARNWEPNPWKLFLASTHGFLFHFPFDVCRMVLYAIRYTYSAHVLAPNLLRRVMHGENEVDTYKWLLKQEPPKLPNFQKKVY